jgi:hypothetical protein
MLLSPRRDTCRYAAELYKKGEGDFLILPDRNIGVNQHPSMNMKV